MKKTLLNIINSSLLFLVAMTAQADNTHTPGHIASDTQINLPQRGDNMKNVRIKFGNPIKEGLTIGQPPITQWKYKGFNVFFEHQYVIHAINLETLIIPSYNGL